MHTPGHISYYHLNFSGPKQTLCYAMSIITSSCQHIAYCIFVIVKTEVLAKDRRRTLNRIKVFAKGVSLKDISFEIAQIMQSKITPEDPDNASAGRLTEIAWRCHLSRLMLQLRPKLGTEVRQGVYLQ